MNDTSRAQGWAITAGAAVAALLFLVGILNGSYWAIALPVAVVTLFALGLVAWVGFTIATIQVEADQSPAVLATDEPERAAPSSSATEASLDSDDDSGPAPNATGSDDSKEDAA
jgi:hypothetical protein